MRTLRDRFVRDERGAVLVIVGLLMVPLIGLIGAAVDFSIAARRQTQLQIALDQATLAIARDPPANDAAVTRARAEQLMRAQLSATGVPPDQWQLTQVTDAGGKVSITAESTVRTVLMSILNNETVKVGTSTEVTREQTKLEVALVLDNSSSMATVSAGRPKVEAAKEAANALVDSLFLGKPTSEFIKISVVPYTSSVKVGAEYANASWVDTAGVSSIHWWKSGENKAVIEKPAWAASRFGLFNELGIPWAGCFETRPNGLGFTDDPPSDLNPDSLFVPMFAPDEPGQNPHSDSCSPLNQSGACRTYASRPYVNSYLDDDGGACIKSGFTTNALLRQRASCKYKTGQAASKLSLTTRYGGIATGPNFMCNGVPILRMTNERDTVKGRIGQLAALGDTTMFEGLAWGWRTLSPNTPFADGKAYGTADNKKILILLTDGNNNWLSYNNDNRSIYAPMSYYGNNRIASGLTTVSAANAVLNQKTKDVCANAKGKGVIIYTVGLMVGAQQLPEEWADIVNSCASTVDGKLQAYVATDGNQLVQVFKNIGSQLSKLRVSH
jgi:Flp pilus assembly protein TadG